MPDLPTLIAAYPELVRTTSQGVAVAFVPLTEVHGTITSAYAVPYLDRDTCLVVRRRDGNWTIPGGTIQPEETWEETLRREILEETGAEIECFEAVGAYRLSGESALAEESGVPMLVVVLSCSHPELERRIQGESRRAKRKPRDMAVFKPGSEMRPLIDRGDHVLQRNTTDLSAEEAADRILEWVGTLGGADSPIPDVSSDR